MEARGHQRHERSKKRLNTRRGEQDESHKLISSATALPPTKVLRSSTRQAAIDSATATVTNVRHSGGPSSRSGATDPIVLFRPSPSSNSSGGFVRSRRRRLQAQDPDKSDPREDVKEEAEDAEEEERDSHSLDDDDPNQLEAIKAQQRRIRQREMKRRSRMRKKLEMEQLHFTMRQLEEKYRSILNKPSPHNNEQNELAMELSDISSAIQQPQQESDIQTNASILQQKYTLLTQEIQQLRVQNSAFREKVMAYDRFTSSIETIMTEYQCPLSIEQLGELFDSLQIPPLDEDLLTDLYQDSVKQIAASSVINSEPACSGSDNESGFVDSASSADRTYDFMDWTEVRFRLDSRVEFSFSKLFGGHDWQTLCQVTWNLLTQTQTQPRSNAELTKHSRVTILQRLHDDCVVVKRSVYDESLEQFAEGVFLVFRAETPQGLAMGLRSIQHPSVEEIKVQQKAFNVAWIEAFNWFLFQQEQKTTVHGKWSIRDLLQDDDSSTKFVGPPVEQLHPQLDPRGPDPHRTRVTFGGLVETHGMEVESARLMVIEILAYLVRWESMVRGEAWGF